MGKGKEIRTRFRVFDKVLLETGFETRLGLIDFLTRNKRGSKKSKNGLLDFPCQHLEIYKIFG